LAAIVAVDVVGSSQLMEREEDATVDAIIDLAISVLRPVAARHGGRIFKNTGDGALMEFASPVAAVLCSIDTQTETRAKTGGTVDVQVRIGVNMGDVVVTEDDDLLGDAVNVAARLQGLADAGGICVSGKVFDELEGKLALPFEDRGEHRLKNISRPIRLFQLRSALVSAREPTAARPASPRTDRPSLAVLPFANLSGDPEHEYFADGVTDDLIVALDKARWLSVAARSSSFAFKGKAVETALVAQRLAVRYLLSGSVRRSGDIVRISVQLGDATTGESIWAERYDRTFGDILRTQDEITEQVAGAIEPELLRREGELGAMRSQSVTAWDLIRRGMWEFHKVRSDSHLRARELFRQAVELEPSSPETNLWLARVEAGLAFYGWSDDLDASYRTSVAAATRAVELDDRNPYCHYALAVAYVFGADLDESRLDVANRAARRVMELNPHLALGHLVLGLTDLAAGRFAAATQALEHGLRLSPFDPQNFTWLLFLATAHGAQGEHEAGLANARRALDVRPGWLPAMKVALFCAAATGDTGQAEAIARNIRSAPPGGDLPHLVDRFGREWMSQVDAAVDAWCRRIDEHG
jgi:adenylate cyclase